MSLKLGAKSMSIESLASSIHTSDDLKAIEGLLFNAIETGNTQVLNSILDDESIKTVVLQILLMKTIPNDDEKYSLEPDPSLTHLLGDSFVNLNALQLACLLGEEDMACLLFDFIYQMTLEMDAKILLLEFIHRTFGQSNTILHLAAYLGQKHLVKKLIESGASVYMRNANKYKPIDLVDDPETSLIFTNVISAPPRSELTFDTVPKKLSRQNTPVKPVTTNGSSPQKKPTFKKSVKFDNSCMLLDICKNGLSKTVTHDDFKDLINQCNYLEIASPQKSMSLVHMACSYGHSDILEVLLKHSPAFLNHQDAEGWTPAHCASAEGHLNVLHQLGRFGPIVRDGCWDIFAEHPIDLEIKTFDGESIEDVSLPEKKSQILDILKYLHQKQAYAANIEPDLVFLVPDYHLSQSIDSKEAKYDPDIGDCNKNILGPIKEALYLSSESIFIPPHSLNIQLDQKDPNIKDEYDDIEKAQDVIKDEYDINKTLDNIIEDNMFSDDQNGDFHLNAGLEERNPKLCKVNCSDAELLDTRKSISEPLLNSTEQSNYENVPNSTTAQAESLPASDDTMYEAQNRPLAELSADLANMQLNSKNPFLEIIFGSCEVISSAQANCNIEIHQLSKESKKQNDYDMTHTELNHSDDNLSGLSIRERLKRLKQLGVQ